MTTTTLKALKLSIAHHKKNLKAKTSNAVELGKEACALCNLFWKSDGDNIRCYGCPVLEASGEHACRGTPYIELHVASKAWEWAWPGEANDRLAQRRTAFRAAERAEIKFLESLLPKGKKP